MIRYRLTITDRKGSISFGVCCRDSLNRWLSNFLNAGYTCTVKKLSPPVKQLELELDLNITKC